jgi:hypothetical protein
MALAAGWLLCDWRNEKKIKRLSDKWRAEDSIKETSRGEENASL